MGRRQAREAALQALFRLDLNPGDETQREAEETLALDMAFCEGEGLTSEEREFASSLLRGTRDSLPEIDRLIMSHAKGWKLSRMAAVDRNIMRMAVYEMIRKDDPVDNGVAVNEAVELAKKYGTEDSGRFVNGILGAVVRGAEAASKHKTPGPPVD